MSDDKTGRGQVINFTAGIGGRINEISRLAGGKKKLARAAGLSESQLHRIISGESQAKIENIAAMAVHCGVTIDWLATGGMPGVASAGGKTGVSMRTDGTLMRDVLTAVEEYLEAHGLKVLPSKKAEAIVLLYDYSRVKGCLAQDAMERLLRLAAE